MNGAEYIKEIMRLCEKIADVKVLRQVYTILLRYEDRHRGG